MSFSKTYRVLALVLAFALCGVPELLAQTQSAQPAQQPAQPQQTQPNMTADPSLGPIEPAQSTSSTSEQTSDQTQTAPQQTSQAAQPLPDAPSNTQSSSSSSTQPASNVRPQEPAGTAAAGKPESVGGAVSKPAGTAMAPAKQRQVRSWLIRLGAIAAAGAALGIVYGLSKSTSPKPPGAAATTAP
jgi:cytoskeletal protein RodZ